MGGVCKAPPIRRVLCDCCPPRGIHSLALFVLRVCPVVSERRVGREGGCAAPASTLKTTQAVQNSKGAAWMSEWAASEKGPWYYLPAAYSAQSHIYKTFLTAILLLDLELFDRTMTWFFQSRWNQHASDRRSSRGNELPIRLMVIGEKKNRHIRSLQWECDGFSFFRSHRSQTKIEKFEATCEDSERRWSLLGQNWPLVSNNDLMRMRSDRFANISSRLLDSHVDGDFFKDREACN